MSRIGKKPIELPKGVEVKQEGNAVTIKGPKGSLSTTLIAGIGLKVDKNVLQFTRGDEEGKTRAFHGLMRALVANNVRGVSEGFKRELDIVVDAKTGHITITGIDKQKVGQTAAEIRSLREPDPYKGKGIKYSNEIIRRKAGKAAGK